MRIVTISLCLLSIVMTALPIVNSKAWWIRIFDFPRLQIAALCLISIILALKYLDLKKGYSKLATILVGCAFLYQSALIIQFTPLYPVDGQKAIGETSDKVSIIQSNVKMDNRETEKFKEMIYRHEPDIVCVNESDQWWIDELDELRKLYPYAMEEPLSNTYGMFLLSKLPLKNAKINYLVQEGIPSFFATVVLPSGKEFDLHCLHPEPPKPGSSTGERDIELLIVGRKVKSAGRPSIVVGDLNDVAWSDTSKRFKNYSGMVDPRQGRGFYNSYNVFFPLFRYPLDHFFYTPEFGFRSMQKLDPIGSDHYPMIISLSL